MTSNTAPRLRVLVIEDEMLIRWSVAQALVGSGHSVVEAADGHQAVDLLTTPGQHIDVVLLDFRLPDSNDLTLLASVRRLAPHSAVVLMTAYGTPDVVEGALAMGADAVIDKPFDLSVVENALLAAHSHRSR